MDGTAQNNQPSSSDVLKIEQILLDEKILTKEQADLVSLESGTSGKSVDAIIEERGFATREQIVSAHAKASGFSEAVLSGKLISPEILDLFPETLARRYVALPFELDKENGVLSVAMSDPLDLASINFLEKRTQKKIKPFYASGAAIKESIDHYYSKDLGAVVSQALKESPSETEVFTGRDSNSAIGTEVIRDTPVAKIVERLLEYAINSRASDVHIEPLDENTRVRFRIDGVLHDESVLPSEIHDAIISRVKILSDLKIDERRIPQDGRFTFKTDTNEIDVRVSTLPTIHGEKLVLRLLRKSGGVPSFSELGLRGSALKNLEIAILRPHGVIVVCGPTGSGKTTTLYSVLTKVNSTKINIVTLEDPVEYYIAGVNQVQINPLAGLTFATGLRSFLRQDPNIILVGEIRDQETTDLAIQAALTGHLVFSTLHTSNAAGAIPRFLDLGAEPFLLASSLNAVLGQRILRKICPSCRETVMPPEILVADIKNVLGRLLPEEKAQPGMLQLYRGKGCQECEGTGFLGRIGIFEVLPISDGVSKLILSHTDANEVERKAIEEGMITMKQDGYLKAIEGVTTIEEVLRVAQD
jgi:type IV pilus assembly protein PilB